MSGRLLRESNSAENEYLAENTLVTIVPRFNHPVFNFVSVRLRWAVPDFASVYNCFFVITYVG